MASIRPADSKVVKNPLLSSADQNAFFEEFAHSRLLVAPPAPPPAPSGAGDASGPGKSAGVEKDLASAPQPEAAQLPAAESFTDIPLTPSSSGVSSIPASHPPSAPPSAGPPPVSGPPPSTGFIRSTPQSRYIPSNFIQTSLPTPAPLQIFQGAPSAPVGVSVLDPNANAQSETDANNGSISQAANAHSGPQVTQAGLNSAGPSTSSPPGIPGLISTANSIPSSILGPPVSSAPLAPPPTGFGNTTYADANPKVPPSPATSFSSPVVPQVPKATSTPIFPASSELINAPPTTGVTLPKSATLPFVPVFPKPQSGHFVPNNPINLQPNENVLTSGLVPPQLRQSPSSLSSKHSTPPPGTQTPLLQSAERGSPSVGQSTNYNGQIESTPAPNVYPPSAPYTFTAQVGPSSVGPPPPSSSPAQVGQPLAGPPPPTSSASQFGEPLPGPPPSTSSPAQFGYPAGPPPPTSSPAQFGHAAGPPPPTSSPAQFGQPSAGPPPSTSSPAQFGHPAGPPPSTSSPAQVGQPAGPPPQSASPAPPPVGPPPRGNSSPYPSALSRLANRSALGQHSSSSIRNSQLPTGPSDSQVRFFTPSPPSNTVLPTFDQQPSFISSSQSANSFISPNQTTNSFLPTSQTTDSFISSSQQNNTEEPDKGKSFLASAASYFSLSGIGGSLSRPSFSTSQDSGIYQTPSHSGEFPVTSQNSLPSAPYSSGQSTAEPSTPQFAAGHFPPPPSQSYYQVPSSAGSVNTFQPQGSQPQSAVFTPASQSQAHPQPPPQNNSRPSSVGSASSLQSAGFPPAYSPFSVPPQKAPPPSSYFTPIPEPNRQHSPSPARSVTSSQGSIPSFSKPTNQSDPATFNPNRFDQVQGSRDFGQPAPSNSSHDSQHFDHITSSYFNLRLSTEASQSAQEPVSDFQNSSASSDFSVPPPGLHSNTSRPPPSASDPPPSFLQSFASSSPADPPSGYSQSFASASSFFDSPPPSDSVDAFSSWQQLSPNTKTPSFSTSQPAEPAKSRSPSHTPPPSYASLDYQPDPDVSSSASVTDVASVIPERSIPDSTVAISTAPALPPTSTANQGTVNSYRRTSLKRPSYAPVPDLGLSDSHQPPPLEGMGQAQQQSGPLGTEVPEQQNPGESGRRQSTSPHSPDSPSMEFSGQGSQNGGHYRPAFHHWFFRKDTKRAIWQPFSMADSLNIEQAFVSPDLSDAVKVPTDGGRYDVHVLQRKKSSVYWEEPDSEVRRCSWFAKSPIDARYIPYDENISEFLEEEYKQGCLTNEWNRRIELADGEVIVLHSPHSMAHHQRSPSPDNWRDPPSVQQKPRIVKRGLEDFELSEGEPTQVDHLLLVVHGIGKVCDLRFRSLVEVVDDFRSISLQLIQSHFRKGSECGQVGRVEVLPVEWHQALHTEAIDKRLADITLPSIPKAREFTNDTILDVLFYSSPMFSERIVQAVGAELNRTYNLFMQRNPGFTGGVSLGGHSLGSLILFDMLSHQKEIKTPLTSPVQPTIGEDEEVSNQNAHKSRPPLSRRMSFLSIGLHGPSQVTINYPQLNFHPKAFFAFGSPIGMFVTVRGIESLGEDFRFPTCPRFFNIFHPNDPVAYRVEALVSNEFANIPPVLIPHHKGRKRMHLELKDTMAHITAALKQKLVHSVRSTWNTVFQLAMFQRPDRSLQREVDKALEEEVMQAPDVEPPSPALSSAQSVAEDQEALELRVGSINGGNRVDYVLQEAPLETFNQYISAVRSHVVYWESEDTMLMVLKEIYASMDIKPDSQVPQQILPFDINAEDHYSEYTDSIGAPPTTFVRK